MPKQLVDIETKIILAGRELLFSEGYTAISMRTIASKCDIAVGTLYNYVKNKDELIAKIALSDWYKTLTAISTRTMPLNTFKGKVEVIFEEIRGFKELYSHLFVSLVPDADSHKTVNSYHPYFRREICKILEPILQELPTQYSEGVKVMLAETIIAGAIHEDITKEGFISYLDLLRIGG